MPTEPASEPGTPGLTPTLLAFFDAKGSLVKEVNGFDGNPDDDLDEVGVNAGAPKVGVNAGAPKIPVVAAESVGGANAALPYAAKGFVCELATGNAAEVPVVAGAATTPPMRSVPPDTPELVD